MVRRPRILVVDDDSTIAELLAMVLTERGYEVALASNGEQALGQIATQSVPALLLVDLMMAIMDGRDFVRHLRTLTAGQSTCRFSWSPPTSI